MSFWLPKKSSSELGEDNKMIQTLFTGKLLKQAYFNFNVELKIHHSEFPVGLISVLFSENL